jgi:c-di-GMP-binding flagellar brake protein YcgR
VEFGRLLNISATGALLRIGAGLTMRREYPLILNMPEGPVPLKAQIMRAKPTLGDHQAASSMSQCLVGVTFTELPPKAKHTIIELCGTAFSQRD